MAKYQSENAGAYVCIIIDTKISYTFDFVTSNYVIFIYCVTIKIENFLLCICEILVDWYIGITFNFFADRLVLDYCWISAYYRATCVILAT